MAIVGIIVVIGGVLGGFLMAGGTLGVLFQPSEFIVIGCAAIGGLLISVPIVTLKKLIADIIGIIKGDAGPSKDSYLQLLVLLNELVQKARKD